MGEIAMFDNGRKSNVEQGQCGIMGEEAMWNNGGKSNLEHWGKEHCGILRKGHAITGKDWIKWGMRQDNCGIMKKPNKQCTLMEIRNEVWGV